MNFNDNKETHSNLLALWYMTDTMRKAVEELMAKEGLRAKETLEKPFSATDGDRPAYHF